MSNKIYQLLQESVNTGASSEARPALLGLTRATTNLIYDELVATQFTTQPTAALFGVKYLNPNGDLTFTSGGTYGGQYGTEERAAMQEATDANIKSFVKDDLFKYLDVVFKVIADNAFDGITASAVDEVISEAVFNSTIRMCPEAATTEKYEAPGDKISEASFEISRWQAAVKSRKLKTDFTVELAQDLEAAGFDAPATLEDVLATQIAEEINKDIMQSNITVATRYKDARLPKALLDVSAMTSTVEAARELYYYINEMNAKMQRETSYSATYVQASTRAAALLVASGWVKDVDPDPQNARTVLKNGMTLLVDTNSPVDYVIVGMKGNYGEDESVASLFYAPFVEGRAPGSDPTDHVGAYKVINDPSSLQPKIALLVRYALSVNPYTMNITDKDARVIDSTDFSLFAGQSKMSVLLGLKLPKLV